MRRLHVRKAGGDSKTRCEAGAPPSGTSVSVRTFPRIPYQRSSTPSNWKLLKTHLPSASTVMSCKASYPASLVDRLIVGPHSVFS